MSNEELAAVLHQLPAGKVVWADAHACFWSPERRQEAFDFIADTLKDHREIKFSAILEGAALALKHPNRERSMARSAATAQQRGAAAKLRLQTEYLKHAHMEELQAKRETDSELTKLELLALLVAAMEIDGDAPVTVGAAKAFRLLQKLLRKDDKEVHDTLIFHQRKTDGGRWKWFVLSILKYLDSIRRQLGGDGEELDRAWRLYVFMLIQLAYLPADTGAAVSGRSAVTLERYLLAIMREWGHELVDLFQQKRNVELRNLVTLRLRAPPMYRWQRKLGESAVNVRLLLLGDAQGRGADELENGELEGLLESAVATAEEQREYTKLAHTIVTTELTPELLALRAEAVLRYQEQKTVRVVELLGGAEDLEDQLPDNAEWRRDYMAILKELNGKVEVLKTETTMRTSSRLLALAAALATRPVNEPLQGLAARFSSKDARAEYRYAKHLLLSSTSIRAAACDVMELTAEAVDEIAANRTVDDLAADFWLAMLDCFERDPEVHDAVESCVERMGGLDKILETFRFHALLTGASLGAGLGKLAMSADTSTYRVSAAFQILRDGNVKRWLASQPRLLALARKHLGYSEEDVQRRTAPRMVPDLLDDVRIAADAAVAEGKVTSELRERCFFVIEGVTELGKVGYNQVDTSTALKMVLFLCSSETINTKRLCDLFGGTNHSYVKEMAAGLTQIRENVLKLEGMTAALLEKRLAISTVDGMVEGAREVLQDPQQAQLDEELRKTCIHVLNNMDVPAKPDYSGRVPSAAKFAASLAFLCSPTKMQLKEAADAFNLGRSTAEIKGLPTRWPWMVDAAVKHGGMDRQAVQARLAVQAYAGSKREAAASGKASGSKAGSSKAGSSQASKKGKGDK